MAVDTANGALRNPFELPDSDGYEWVKGNLHSHTTNSDGRVDPQTRVDGYVGAGYDYLCLSDHRKIPYPSVCSDWSSLGPNIFYFLNI